MQHIVSCSLGKDSVAMLIRMLDEGMQIDRIIFADLGEDAEFEETYAFIEKVEKTLGIHIERIKSEKWTWDRWFYGTATKGKAKGQIHGFPPVVTFGCSYKRELKMKPLAVAQGEGNIIYLGIAADEEHRAKAKQYINAKNQYRFPLIEWGMTEDDCVELCRSRGLLHPLYQYFSRLGCWQCPKQSLKSLRMLYKHFLQKWEKLIEYQNACPWAFKPSASVHDLTRRFANEVSQMTIDDYLESR